MGQPTVGSNPTSSALRSGAVRRHPPMLGEHTDEVLHELGVPDDEIDALRQDGAI